MRRFFIMNLAVIVLASCSSASNLTPSTAAIQPTLTALPAEQSINPPQTSSSPVVIETIGSTATARPTLAPQAWKTLPIVPTSISEQMHVVYERGLQMGNDPKHFSVIGDCQNVSSYFLSVYDQPGEFSLGSEYTYLQPTIDYYQGSYSRKSLAVRGGYNVAAVLSPLRANPKFCNKGESPLDCELRVWRPSVVFVSMETWWSEKPAEEYGKYMRRVIERILATGAVPILATKADNLEGDASINATIAQIANEYELPLWNFWAAVQPLPNHGLSPDNFHLTFARNFFDDPVRMKNAWPWRNLTALQALDAVHKELLEQP